MSDTENQAQNSAQSENEKLAFIASILNATTPNNSGGGRNLTR
mgnify:CR=1 FL=1